MVAGLGQQEQRFAVVDGGVHSVVAVVAFAARLRGDAGFSPGDGPRR